MLSRLVSASKLATRSAPPGAAYISDMVASMLDEYGSTLFDDKKMQELCSPEDYAAFKAAVASGEAMPKANENGIATTLKDWAISHGCVNFAHWFSPIREAYGLKHDTLIDMNFGTGEIETKLSGSRLFTGESDGSSFPNGGLRQTHTAAAYTGWDRTSPPFIRGDTVYIPSSFVAWNGAALDEKTPLLRSMAALEKESLRLLRNMGDNESTEITSNVGWEQEFFVVDRKQFLGRLDLQTAGRTLVGSLPHRGQQTDINYFGAIPPRVKGFLTEIQGELIRNGVPLAVFHNEVAPGQHEFSPIFSMTNRSADTNAMAMELLREVSSRHGLEVLLHEKPFAGMNGSGKHANWSINTDTGVNLYSPGKTVDHQQKFMAFTAAVAHALCKHGDVLRVGVAHAGNDHRLGAQEAPPAIISLYTGVIMEDHIKAIIAGGPLEGYGLGQRMVNTGSNAVQPLVGSVEDRNRTAPFPFCGNRFEFRAVGSSQNIAFPVTMLHCAVVDGLRELNDAIEGGLSVRDAVANMFRDNQKVIFNGNGYSAEWPAEAAERGLLNLHNTPLALDTLHSPKNVELFRYTGVFSEEEVEARQEILYERYINTLQLEVNTMLEMVNGGVLRAIARDVFTYAAVQADAAAAPRRAVLHSATAATAQLQAAADAFPADASLSEQAHYCADVLNPKMEELRVVVDGAERIVSGSLWPMPKYQDLLFSHQSDADSEVYHDHHHHDQH